MSLIEMLVVVGLLGVLASAALPMTAKALEYFRVSGDARDVSNSVAVAKMRAAAEYSQVRLYVDLSTRTHHIERYDKTASQWTTEGGNTTLSTGVVFGYVATNAPLNTQPSIAQAPVCKNNAGNDVGNTACIVFNSRGVPVDTTGAATSLDALYLNDGKSAYAITVSATGMIRTWRAGPQSTATWVLQ